MPTAHEVDRLVDDLRRLMHVRNYSPRTQTTYGRWIRRFLLANRNRRIASLRRGDVERFRDDLAQKDRLAPKSRNQASSAIAFFFREVLGRDELAKMPRAKEPKRIPIVLSHRQATVVLSKLSGKYRRWLVIRLGERAVSHPPHAGLRPAS